MANRLIRRATVLIVALAVALPFIMATSQPAGVTVTFLANEGVLLSSRGDEVLIDALFREYGRAYALPADSTRAALKNATGPFREVDVVLVTHRHGDHFHPASVVSHLRANRRALLVTSPQVIDSMRHDVPQGDPMRARLLGRTVATGAKRIEVVNGITVHLLGLPHGGDRHRGVEHLGYVVELGGRRVLHMGDGDISEAAFAPFRLDTARIDVALLPQWMLLSAEGRRVIDRWIRPRAIVAFHVSAGQDRETERQVRQAMPHAVTFTRSLDARTW